MMNFVETKEMTATKIKAEAKTSVMDVIMAALKNEYGEDNVAMVRTGKSSKTNEIGVRVGTVKTASGAVVDMVCTVGAAGKDFIERKTTSGKVYEVFDFEAAKTAYEDWVADGIAKKADAAEKKAQKLKAAAEKANKEKEDDGE